MMGFADVGGRHNKADILCVRLASFAKRSFQKEETDDSSQAIKQNFRVLLHHEVRSEHWDMLQDHRWIGILRRRVLKGSDELLNLLLDHVGPRSDSINFFKDMENTLGLKFAQSLTGMRRLYEAVFGETSPKTLTKDTLETLGLCNLY